MSPARSGTAPRALAAAVGPRSGPGPAAPALGALPRGTCAPGCGQAARPGCHRRGHGKMEPAGPTSPPPGAAHLGDDEGLPVLPSALHREAPGSPAGQLHLHQLVALSCPLLHHHHHGPRFHQPAAEPWVADGQPLPSAPQPHVLHGAPVAAGAGSSLPAAPRCAPAGGRPRSHLPAPQRRPARPHRRRERAAPPAPSPSSSPAARGIVSRRGRSPAAGGRHQLVATWRRGKCRVTRGAGRSAAGRGAPASPSPRKEDESRVSPTGQPLAPPRERQPRSAIPRPRRRRGEGGAAPGRPPDKGSSEKVREPRVTPGLGPGPYPGHPTSRRGGRASPPPPFPNKSGEQVEGGVKGQPAAAAVPRAGTPRLRRARRRGAGAGRAEGAGSCRLFPSRRGVRGGGSRAMWGAGQGAAAAGAEGRRSFPPAPPGPRCLHHLWGGRGRGLRAALRSPARPL